MNIVIEFDKNEHDNVKKCPSSYQRYAEPLVSEEASLKNTALNNVKKIPRSSQAPKYTKPTIKMRRTKHKILFYTLKVRINYTFRSQ